MGHQQRIADFHDVPGRLRAKKTDATNPVEIETGEPPAASNVRQEESKPVTMNELEFVAMADAVWQLPESDKIQNVDIGLRVNNRSKEAKSLDLFDDLRILLTTQDERELPFRGVRQGDIPSKKVRLAPGETITLARPGQMKWDPREKDRTLYFGGTDGVGGSWSDGAQENLSAGKHSLKISFRRVH